MEIYDKIIVGAGLYGLYSAEYCGRRGERVLVLECEAEAFTRATFVNQARVHMGYHYPRSFSTAIKSAGYFERFVKDYRFCILSEFDQVYATSAHFSWTNAEQFKKFCSDAGIRCDEVGTDKYFNQGMCDGAFLTTEYTYDANILKQYFLNRIEGYNNVRLLYSVNIKNLVQDGSEYIVVLSDGREFHTPFLLNATYASTNQISQKLSYPAFKIKYELCEIILCNVNESLKNIGITVMDGPFFSIMPFGKTGYHSLTSVTFTPHIISYEPVPVFKCQTKSNGYCSPEFLGNCNLCNQRPESAWSYMSGMARKYLKSEYEFEYDHSLFSMKPILKAAEIDDSRPTVIKKFSQSPTYISVLSGKINTVYDLEEVLND